MNVDKFADDLYIVKQDMRPGWFCTVLVVFGKEKIGVIDTGYENTPEDYVFPLIKEKGRTLAEINLVVNTHRDGDHIKGNQTFRDKTNAKIVAHELEEEAISVLDDTYTSGEVLEIGDRKFKAIHTPGHRPGAVVLLDEENNVLVTGDSICGEREDLIRMDKEVYIKSLKGLLNLDIEHMIMSHPFQPAGKHILVGSEIPDMIKASIEVAEKK